MADGILGSINDVFNGITTAAGNVIGLQSQLAQIRINQATARANADIGMAQVDLAKTKAQNDVEIARQQSMQSLYEAQAQAQAANPISSINQALANVATELQNSSTASHPTLTLLLTAAGVALAYWQLKKRRG